MPRFFEMSRDLWPTAAELSVNSKTQHPDKTGTRNGFYDPARCDSALVSKTGPKVSAKSAASIFRVDPTIEDSRFWEHSM